VNFLKHACLTLALLFKQVCQLPQTIANFARQRQQQNMLTELEAERLDRIRHPEKYRGK
jgi:hypothetical protein